MPRLLHKRMLLVLALALAGGLATSVSIAWVRAALDGFGWEGNDWVVTHSHEGGMVGQYPVPASGAFMVYEFRSTAATDRLVWWVRPPWPLLPPFEGHLPGWSIARGPPPDETIDRPEAVERAYGWPMRCVRVSWDFSPEMAAYPGEGLRGGFLMEPVDWGLDLQPGFMPQPDFWRLRVEYRRALPMIPMWTGLATNTLLFATPILLLAMILALPNGLVRWRRRRRDRCLHCAYPKPEGAPLDPERCPECGELYGARPPTWGRWSLGTLILVVLCLWGATIGFGVWRVAAREPMPPAHRAAVLNAADAIDALASLGVPIDSPAPDALSTIGHMLSSTDRPLVWAAARGNDAAVRSLLAAGANVDGSYGKALRSAVESNHADTCRLLLEAGANHARQRSSGDVFDQALSYGDSDTIAVFYEYLLPADPRRLRVAVHVGVRALGEALDAQDWSDAELEAALLEAAKAGDAEAIGMLVSRGVDPASCSRPLLLEAVGSGSVAAVRALVEAGASGNAMYSYRAYSTPLVDAVELGDPTIVDLVLKAGVDPTPAGYQGESVLHLAARTAPVEIVERLAEFGLPLDVRLYSGNTPLMDAVEYRRLDVIESLLAASADPTIRDSRGHTALDIARGYKNDYVEVKAASPEIIRVLEEAMEVY